MELILLKRSHSGDLQAFDGSEVIDVSGEQGQAQCQDGCRYQEVLIADCDASRFEPCVEAAGDFAFGRA